MLVSNVMDEIRTEQAKENWLAYWKYFSRCQDQYCAEINCLNPQHHGVLVKTQRAGDAEIYVIPMCKDHSDNFTALFEIADNTAIVPASYTL
ncbi:hypothetical protein VV869_07760 [Photobacterium sp. MCCC 1A19761]|uniref:hypothetical protein n=1 Tax=Photobacterium sp. MCCC 1A19761 TaxID=3115000 RepID=UPI00307E9B19